MAPKPPNVRTAPAEPWRFSGVVNVVRGPDMAPKPPNVRTAPAEPWRFSGVVNVVRGPDMAPKPPNVRTAPAEPWRFSGVVNVVRGPDMAPKPPNVRTAPAEPWRFSGVVNVVRGPDMAPKPPDTRGAAGSPRCSSRPLVTTVGIVGVGLLGDAVASRLRAAGHAVVGYDVVPAAMERLVAMGGTPAKSAGDVARAADVVCTILPSLATVEEAILGAAGIVAAGKAGQPIVQMSTISPSL